MLEHQTTFLEGGTHYGEEESIVAKAQGESQSKETLVTRADILQS